MSQSKVKKRILFGSIITAGLFGLALLDGYLEGTVTRAVGNGRAIKGTIIFAIVAVAMLLGQIELYKLAGGKKLRIFRTVTFTGTVLLAGSWYFSQFLRMSPAAYLSMVICLSLLALMVQQYLCCGTDSAIINCSVSLMAIVYLGLFSSFIMAIRIEFGLWYVIMFIAVIKSSDIGAYTVGSLIGRHKFAPKVSPGKTLEGLGGAMFAAALTAVLFGRFAGIMGIGPALGFGLCFAVTGQMGDLFESMIKRDARQKDSSAAVPGFGGVLDIIDSPLIAAPFAYLFFYFLSNSAVAQ